MTAPAPEATVPSVELARVSTAKRVLAKDGVSLLDVLTAIAGESIAKLPETAPVAKAPKEVAPKPIVLPQELVDAIGRFVEEAKAVQGELPEKRSKLTARQRTNLGKLFRSSKKIKNDVDKLIKDTIRVAFFNHFDVLAEQTDGFDVAAVQRDTSGFFLVAAEEEIPDVGTVKGELSGGTPELDLKFIEQAIKAGRLPTTATNGITRQARVLDDAKAVKWFAQNPQYADVLAEATVVKGASRSLQLR